MTLLMNNIDQHKGLYTVSWQLRLWPRIQQVLDCYANILILSLKFKDKMLYVCMSLKTINWHTSQSIRTRTESKYYII